MATIFLPYYFVESSRFRQKRHGGNKTKRKRIRYFHMILVHVKLTCIYVSATVCFCLRI